MKKIISVLMPILAIFFLVGGTYYYLNAGNKNFKEEHSKYISLINDSYDFKNGLNGLETLTTEKAKETLRNIDNEINTASELVRIDTALNNADIEKAHDHLKQAKKLDVNHTFSKAISYLDEQLDHYDNALTEILELDISSATYANQIQTILAKYDFKYEALKEKLLNSETSELEQDHKTSVTKKEETKKELGNRESSKKDTTSSNKNSNSTKNNSYDTKKVSSIPNTQNHPQIVGQQVPETYNTIRYTQEGSTSRNIIENELKGDISNFTNEEINAAIANYNAKNQG
ncbi:hypothetical protein [uncultured Gemella sp.]|uniref:hypothetical protein n=1 Tax=uncultured Gemella sp. TaxID=254352 RepID=UPI0028D70547|nr:hypothetical protein [uncultured Gemella sp.]